MTALYVLLSAVAVVVVFGLYHAWDLWNRRDEDKAPATGFGDSDE